MVGWVVGGWLGVCVGGWVVREGSCWISYYVLSIIGSACEG